MKVFSFQNEITCGMYEEGTVVQQGFHRQSIRKMQ